MKMQAITLDSTESFLYTIYFTYYKCRILSSKLNKMRSKSGLALNYLANREHLYQDIYFKCDISLYSVFCKSAYLHDDVT